MANRVSNRSVDHALACVSHSAWWSSINVAKAQQKQCVKRNHDPNARGRSRVAAASLLEEFSDR